MAGVPSSRIEARNNPPGTRKPMSAAKVKVVQGRRNLREAALAGMRSTTAKVGISTVCKVTAGGSKKHTLKTTVLGHRATVASVGKLEKGKISARMLMDSGGLAGVVSSSTTAKTVGAALKLMLTVGRRRITAHGTKSNLIKIGGNQVEKQRHGQIAEALAIVKSGPCMVKQMRMHDLLHIRSKTAGAGQINPETADKGAVRAKAGVKIPGVIAGALTK